MLSIAIGIFCTSIQEPAMPAKKDDDRKKGKHPEQQKAEREEKRTEREEKKAMRRERKSEPEEKRVERQAEPRRKEKKPEAEDLEAREGPSGNKKAQPNVVPAKPSLRNDHFPIVGIGASAGGLRALEGFFSQMVEDARIALVVIQHQDPKRQSMLKGLLERYTELPVVTAEDGMKVEADHVYLKPPEKDLVIEDHRLRLVDPPQDAHLRLPIDTFFRSLAADQKERAICIILSGAGSDGAQGLKEIKAEGGMVMAQSQKQAEYDSMPRSAIDTGLVDFILPVERMPEALVHYIDHPFLTGEAEAAEKEEDVIRRILIRVRQKTGHDLSQYKRNTIRRRIQRRMAVNRIGTMEDYLPYLGQHGDEVHALFKNLIINVTNFFREPETFEAMQGVLRDLVKEKPQEEALRVWVPGCASGEEAYSIAMLLVEEEERQDKFFDVKIFATDINAEGIETAREGEYPENIVADVSSERLRRFFSKKDAAYRVGSKIREMVIFAVHDINRDPPFSHLDLVSFRNVLIYMDTSLQKRVLPIVHYSLKTGGILFLGSSEGIVGYDDLFESIDRQHKVFRALDADPHQYIEQVSRVITSPGARRMRREQVERPDEGEGPDVRELTDRTLLERFCPPSVLIDEHHQAVYFQGETHRYLAMPPGEPSLHILHLTRGTQLYRKLSVALRQIGRENKPVAMEEIHIPHNDSFLVVDAVLTPVQDPTERTPYYLLTFQNERRGEPAPAKEGPGSASAKKGAERPEGDPGRRIEELETKLQKSRHELQATVEEMETSNEELKSANEELQANNEELQSTNEELESSREELQSTNEELETVNSELQKKNEELGRARDDLENLFNASDIGTLFLDTEMRIKRFTPCAAKIFNLREQDLGRPIGDITSRMLNYNAFEKDVEEVLDNLGRNELEVKTQDGRWLSVRIAPYRTSRNVITGAVVTFVDVTELKEAERTSHESLTYAEGILETVSVPLVVLGEDLKVKSANRAFYETFKVASEKAHGKPIWHLGDGRFDNEPLHQALEEVIPERSEVRGYKIEQDLPEIGKRKLSLNAKQINREEGRPKLILISFEGVTEGEAAEQR
jgi:two-component system CheB/CheR fusion protein